MAGGGTQAILIRPLTESNPERAPSRSVYVRGQSGKLAAARIYDDGNPPLAAARLFQPWKDAPRTLPLGVPILLWLEWKSS